MFLRIFHCPLIKAGNVQEWLQGLAAVFSALHAPNASLVHARASSDPKALPFDQVSNYRAAHAAYSAAHAQSPPPLPASGNDLANTPKDTMQISGRSKGAEEFESVADVIVAALAKLQLNDQPSKSASKDEPPQGSLVPPADGIDAANAVDTVTGDEVPTARHSPPRPPPLPGKGEVALPPPPPPRSSPRKPGQRIATTNGVGPGLVTDWEASLVLDHNDWPLLASLGLILPSAGASGESNDGDDAKSTAASPDATLETTTASTTTVVTTTAEDGFLSVVSAASKAAISAAVNKPSSSSQVASSNLAAPSVPSSSSTPRSFTSGEQAVSQADVYRYVWAPLAVLVLNAKKRAATTSERGSELDHSSTPDASSAATKRSAVMRAKVLVSALIAYLAALRQHKLAVVEPRIPALLVKLLATTNRLQELVQLVHYKVRVSCMA